LKSLRLFLAFRRRRPVIMQASCTLRTFGMDLEAFFTEAITEAENVEERSL
jgi:hypothetical protein